jgi:hypothetical protein
MLVMRRLRTTPPSWSMCKGDISLTDEDSCSYPFDFEVR